MASKIGASVGILGSGDVAKTLAKGFYEKGHPVKIGSRETAKLADFVKQFPNMEAVSFEAAAKFGEFVVLAVKGTAAASCLQLCGESSLNGKIILDACNPIADAPPVNGCLQLFSSPEGSLMESLQAKYPKANFVKCFNSVGAGCMVNPKVHGGPPTMFIAGNDAAAKQRIQKEILHHFGWESLDCGPASGARAIEPLVMLWCLPGFLHNDWVHAFKMLHK